MTCRGSPRCHRPRRLIMAELPLNVPLGSKSPQSGSQHNGWHYVRVAFFRGTSLRPVPPGESKHKEVRYLDIRENDQLDEAQVATWITQATSVPGWIP